MRRPACVAWDELNDKELVLAQGPPKLKPKADPPRAVPSSLAGANATQPTNDDASSLLLTNDEQRAALKTCSAHYVHHPLRQPSFAMTYFAKDDRDGKIFNVCAPCAHTCFNMQDIDVLDDLGALRQPFSCACQAIVKTGHRCFWSSKPASSEEDDAVEKGGKRIVTTLASPANEALMEKRWRAEYDAFFGSVLASIEYDNERQRKQREEKMTEKLRGMQENFEQYYDPSSQQLALETIPIQKLTELADKNLAADPNSGDEMVKQLLRWFKHDFFSWVNSPACDAEGCGGSTEITGRGHPNVEEKSNWASVVELYKCKACGKEVRFPRYNKAKRLLTWRKGRCGEWANCFALCCVTLGFSTRFVNDSTDHVWVEVYSEGRGRWIHCDPCENTFDSPHMYETGWGKKLQYIFAVNREEVVDVIRRYSKRSAHLPSRNEVSEVFLSRLCRGMNWVSHRRARGPKQLAEVQARSEKERQELSNVTQIAVEDATGATFRGRSTGSNQWRRTRGEDGADRDGEGTSEGGQRTADSVTHQLPPLDADSLRTARPLSDTRRDSGGDDDDNAPQRHALGAFCLSRRPQDFVAAASPHHVDPNDDDHQPSDKSQQRGATAEGYALSPANTITTLDDVLLPVPVSLKAEKRHATIPRTDRLRCSADASVRLPPMQQQREDGQKNNKASIIPTCFGIAVGQTFRVELKWTRDSASEATLTGRVWHVDVPSPKDAIGSSFSSQQPTGVWSSGPAQIEASCQLILPTSPSNGRSRRIEGASGARVEIGVDKLGALTVFVSLLELEEGSWIRKKGDAKDEGSQATEDGPPVVLRLGTVLPLWLVEAEAALKIHGTESRLEFMEVEY